MHELRVTYYLVSVFASVVSRWCDVFGQLVLCSLPFFKLLRHSRGCHYLRMALCAEWPGLAPVVLPQARVQESAARATSALQDLRQALSPRACVAPTACQAQPRARCALQVRRPYLIYG